MMKFFKKVAVCLVLGGMSLSMTSCDSDVITGILGQLVEALTGTAAGQTYTYNGTEVLDCYGDRQSDGSYKTLLAHGQMNNKGVTFVAKQVGSIVQGEVTLPACKDEKVTISEITVGGITCTTQNDNTILSLPDEYTADGTVTVGGKNYAITGVFIDKASYVNTSKINLVMSIFYGDGLEYAVNVTYTGDCTNAPEQ